MRKIYSGRWRFSSYRWLLVLTVSFLPLVPMSTGRWANAETQPSPARSTVRIPFPDDEGSLTPYSYKTGYSLVTLIYDTLMWRDRDGVPKPWLARLVTTSPDGRTVTVNLVEGVHWHDGAPVTSEDVAFTFRFVAEHHQPRFTPEVADVQRVDAPDPLTAVITLREPVAGFADQPLADVPILPAHLWASLAPDQDAPSGLPVGSGPYRLTDYHPGTSYSFDANLDYFKGPPAVSHIDVPIVPAAEDTLTRFARGDLDMLPDNIPPQRVGEITGPETRILAGPTYLGTVLMFNLRQAPFDRTEVRRALAGAIDQAQVARAAGDATAADRGYLHPDSAWASSAVLYTPDLRAPPGAIAALSLPPVEILGPDDNPQQGAAGREVVAELDRAGVRATFKAVSPQELSKAVGEDGSDPTFQVAMWRTPALAAYDPSYLPRLFGSDPGIASLNYSGYASREFGELAQRVSTTVDPAGRHQAVDQIQRLLASDIPALPLYFASGAFAVHPAVYDGWVFVKGAGILDKQSFLGSRGSPAPPRAATGPTTSTPGDDPSGGGLPLGAIAIVLLGLGAIVAAVAWYRR